MDIERIFFYGFSSLALISASLMVFIKNPVKALLCLALTFFSVVPLWLLLKAEFLSMILILVYVGAIMVLFLFVIMMVDIEIEIQNARLMHYFPIGLLVGVSMAIILVYSLKDFAHLESGAGFSLNQLGLVLYSNYLYPLEIAGILLLSAMIAAIQLNFKRKKTKTLLKTEAQLKASKATRLTILKDGA